MTYEQARQFVASLPKHAKVKCEGTIYEFGYLSLTGKFILYQEECHDGWFAVVDPEWVECETESA